MSKLDLINTLKDCVRLISFFDPKHPLIDTAVKVVLKEEGSKKDIKWLTQSFDMFWKEYPKKTVKKQAKEQWFKLNADKKLFNKIMKELDMQNKHKMYLKQKNEFYAPFQDAIRWIKNERWTDETPNVRKANTITLNRNTNGGSNR